MCTLLELFVYQSSYLSTITGAMQKNSENCVNGISLCCTHGIDPSCQEGRWIPPWGYRPWMPVYPPCRTRRTVDRLSTLVYRSAHRSLVKLQKQRHYISSSKTKIRDYWTWGLYQMRQCPQIGWQYGIKNKAAIGLQYKSNAKLIAALLFIDHRDIAGHPSML